MQENLSQDVVYSIAAVGQARFAARHSGLYRSDDGGQSWQLTYGDLPFKAPPPALAVVAAPDATLFTGVPGGVLRSADAGLSWQVSALDAPPPLVSALAVSPAFERDGTVFAATLDDGIYCSTDRGARWTRWNFGLLDLSVTCLLISPDFAQDETVFAGTESGIFRSTNGGRAWREVDFAPDDAPVMCLGYRPGGGLLAGTETRGLFRSDDGGESWSAVGDLSLAVNALAFDASGALLVVQDERLLRQQGDGWHTLAEMPEVISTLHVLPGMALVGLVTGEVLAVTF